jgi:hypothetical protein
MGSNGVSNVGPAGQSVTREAARPNQEAKTEKKIEDFPTTLAFFITQVKKREIRNGFEISTQI